MFIEDLSCSDSLHNVELFIFTDSTTSEAGCYRGTSANAKLFSLVLRLRRVEMKGTTQINVIYVACSQIIDHDMDGLSQALTTEGVMRGSSILNVVPLYLSTLDISQTLLPWLKQWLSEDMKVLTPKK